MGIQAAQLKKMGGRRVGAGRPKGAISKSTRALIEAAEKKGITPLEVMLLVMRKRLKARDFVGAAQAASMAAPYLHPKLAATSLSGPGGGPIPFADVDKLSKLSDEDLQRAISIIEKLSAAGGAEGGAAAEGDGT